MYVKLCVTRPRLGQDYHLRIQKMNSATCFYTCHRTGGQGHTQLGSYPCQIIQRLLLDPIKKPSMALSRTPVRYAPSGPTASAWKTDMSRAQFERDDPLDLSILLSGVEKKLTRTPSVAASEDGEAQRLTHAPILVFGKSVTYVELKSGRR